jgi:hypothetical protein
MIRGLKKLRVSLKGEICFVSILEMVYVSYFVGRDTSGVIGTRYELDGPGIEFRWGCNFPHPSSPALGSTQPPTQWVPGLSRKVKRPGSGVDHPPPSSVEVKGRVELYLYSASGPSWPVIFYDLHK